MSRAHHWVDNTCSKCGLQRKLNPCSGWDFVRKEGTITHITDFMPPCPTGDPR